MERNLVGFRLREGEDLSRKGYVRMTQHQLLLTYCTLALAIYTKTGGKNSKYSWTPEINNISGAAAIHVQLFQHVFRDRYSETHHQPILGMRQFEILASWQFLCAASAPKSLHHGEMFLASCDHAIFEELERLVSSISTCMLGFVGKKGQKTAEGDAGDDNNDAEAEE